MSLPRSIVRTVIGIAALSAAGTLASAAAHAGYHVTAFANAAGFEEIMTEDFAAAQKMLRTPEFEHIAFARHANLCVARLKLADVGAALASCERAVDAGPRSFNSTVSPVHQDRLTILTHLYSNRGVARAMNGDMTGARADFERALDLEPKNENARMNLEIVSVTSVAAGQ